jgi:hypothetical protein
MHETYKIKEKRYENNFDDVFTRCRVDWCSHISLGVGANSGDARRVLGMRMESSGMPPMVKNM